jgi:hypothetical protein
MHRCYPEYSIYHYDTFGFSSVSGSLNRCRALLGLTLGVTSVTKGRTQNCPQRKIVETYRHDHSLESS